MAKKRPMPMSPRAGLPKTPRRYGCGGKIKK